MLCDAEVARVIIFIRQTENYDFIKSEIFTPNS